MSYDLAVVYKKFTPVLTVLNVAVRNAVNAGILSLAVVYHNPSEYNYTSWAGIWAILHVIVIPAVAIREGMVWIPKLLQWSSTNPTDPTVTLAVDPPTKQS